MVTGNIKSSGFIAELENFAKEISGGVLFNKEFTYEEQQAIDQQFPTIKAQGRSENSGNFGDIVGHYRSPYTGKSGKQITFDEGCYETTGGYFADHNPSMQRIISQKPELKDILQALFVGQKRVQHSNHYSPLPDDLSMDWPEDNSEKAKAAKRAEEARAAVENEAHNRTVEQYKPYMQALMTLQDIADGMLDYNPRSREKEGFDSFHLTVCGGPDYIALKGPEPLTLERIQGVINYAKDVDRRKLEGEVVDDVMVQFVTEHKADLQQLGILIYQNTRQGHLEIADPEKESELMVAMLNDDKKRSDFEWVASDDNKIFSNAGTPKTWFERDETRRQAPRCSAMA